MLLAALFVLAGCGGSPAEPPPFEWHLPPSFPLPRVPEDNPMTTDKIELGRRLFYDERLSDNGTQSCASCHHQELAFTDQLARAKGSTDQVHPRGSMSLANIAYASTLTWANPLQRELERQANLPLFGSSPIVELGMNEDELVRRLRADLDYVARFEDSFPEDADPVSVANVTRALAAFQRTLLSGGSPYDRYLAGDSTAMSESAQRGMDIFFDNSGETSGNSDTAECFHCHGGFLMSSAVDHAMLAIRDRVFFNTGLYNVDGRGAYPEENRGLAEFTGEDEDVGRFKPPTLRNIAVTAPYMHDGSIATLEEVLDHYSRGGRLIPDGANAGDGRENPNKNLFIHGFSLDAEQKRDLIAFLEALTDEEFLTNPAYSDPFAP